MFSNFAPPAGDLHILAYTFHFVKHFFHLFSTFSKIGKEGHFCPSQTVEKPQFCIRQNWGFERIVAKI